jgi:vesicular inhibitory amino acid transporter
MLYVARSHMKVSPSAKILARIMISDPKLRTYADIGQKAFGPRSTVFTTFFFCLELFAVR